jgi:hypothetical protein
MDNAFVDRDWNTPRAFRGGVSGVRERQPKVASPAGAEVQGEKITEPQKSDEPLYISEIVIQIYNRRLESYPLLLPEQLMLNVFIARCQ